MKDLSNILLEKLRINKYTDSSLHIEDVLYDAIKDFFKDEKIGDKRFTISKGAFVDNKIYFVVHFEDELLYRTLSSKLVDEITSIEVTLNNKRCTLVERVGYEPNENTVKFILRS